MAYLSRKTTVLVFFSPQNKHLTPFFSDQFTWYLGSLTFSLISAGSTNDVLSYETKEFCIAHDSMRVYCNYFFLEQTKIAG